MENDLVVVEGRGCGYNRLMVTSTVTFFKMLHIVRGARSSKQEFYVIGDVEGKLFLLHYLSDGLTSWTTPQFLDDKFRKRILARFRTEVRERSIDDIAQFSWVVQVYHHQADVVFPKGVIGQTPHQLGEHIQTFLQTEWQINTLHEHPDDFISLAVPFEEKDAVKSAGARWNSALRVWEIHRSKDLNAVAKWIPSGKPAVSGVNVKPL